MEKYFRKIDELNQRYIKVWEDVCNLESPTGDKAGVDRVGAYFAKMAEERGFLVEYCRQETAGDVVCITMNPESELQPVVVSGHIDTVHPVGAFGTPAVHRDEEKIYGPGVTDCKGGVVAGMLAMDALYECGFQERPVTLILQTDEETGSRTSGGKTIQYICERAKNAAVFLNMETHHVGEATTSRKGILSYKFEVEGKAGHASRCAYEGASAIADAAHKIIALEKLKDDDGITCNCGIVSGGTTVNTVPEKCTFSVNFRYATQAQQAWIEEFVQSLAATQHVPGCKCSVYKLGGRPAMERTEANLNAIEKVNKIFAQHGVLTLKERKNRGGSDASNVTQYGIACIDSLGTVGGGSHSTNEFAVLSSLTDAAKRVALIAARLT